MKCAIRCVTCVVERVQQLRAMLKVTDIDITETTNHVDRGRSKDVAARAA